MPPARRRSGNAATSRSTSGQSTLSFGSKSRVSKPSSAQQPGKKSKDTKAIVEIPSTKSATQAPVAHEIEEATQQPTAASSRSERLVQEQARLEVRQAKSEEDRRAEALDEDDIKQYWAAREDERIASRVHQEDLTMYEKILRHFDLSNQYGPCIGIARIKRWKRAHGLNLNPPIEVLSVLLRQEAQGQANEKAYIDELLS